MIDSQINNVIDCIGGIRVKRYHYKEHYNEDISEILIEYIKSIIENKSNNKSINVKIYIEDLLSLRNKELLLLLRNSSLNFSIYINDIAFRELINKDGKNVSPIDGTCYIKETLYINQQIIDDDNIYYSDTSFLNALYKAKENQEGPCKKIDFYFNTSNKLEKIFSNFINGIKKTSKHKSIGDIAKGIVKPASVFSDSSGVLEGDLSNIEGQLHGYISSLINDLKEHVNKYNADIEKIYGLKIEISEEQYSKIEKSLTDMYTSLFSFIANKFYKIAEKFNYKVLSKIDKVNSNLAAIIEQVGAVIQLYLEFNIEWLINSLVYISPIFPYLSSIVMSNLDALGSVSSKKVMRDLMYNNILFYKFVEILGSDLLFLLNYQTGIKGTRIDIEDKRIILLPKVVSKYSQLPSYGITFELDQTNKECSKYLEKKEKTCILENNCDCGNKDSDDGKKIKYNGKDITLKELMLFNTIKSLKYLLFIETPNYFLPYIDNLLKENFNLIQNVKKKYNTTGSNVNIIIFTSLLNKWQEKFITNRIENVYGAAPVRYSLSSKQSNSLVQDYKDYDIILKSSVIKNKQVSKITYLTYFNRIDVSSFHNKLKSDIKNIVDLSDKLNEKIKNSESDYGDDFEDINNLLGKLHEVVSGIEEYNKIFEEFCEEGMMISKRKDLISGLNRSFAVIAVTFNELYYKYKKYNSVKNDYIFTAINKVNKGIKYYIELFSALERYLFTSSDNDRIKMFKYDYAENVDKFLKETILQEHVGSIIEHKYDIDKSIIDNNIENISLLKNIVDNENYKDIENVIKYIILSTIKYDFSNLRYYIMRLHYDLDNDLEKIKKELSGSLHPVEGKEGIGKFILNSLRKNIPLISPDIEYGELEKLGILIWQNVDNIILNNKKISISMIESHFKCSFVLKKQFLLHIFVDNNILTRYLHDYEDRLVNIVTGMYFSVKFYNHLMEYIIKNKNILNKILKDKENIFIKFFVLYCLEELFIIAKNLSKDRGVEARFRFIGHGHITSESVFEFDDISDKYINTIHKYINERYKKNYKGFFNNVTNNNREEYVHKESVTGYGSSLYKNYIGQQEQDTIGTGSPEFRTDIYDNKLINIIEKVKFIKIKYGSLFYKSAKKIGLSSIAAVVTGDSANYNNYGIMDGLKNVISKKYADLLEGVGNFAKKTVVNQTLDLKYKTLDEKKLERYMNYVKYTHLVSPNQAPLVKVSADEIIIPGNVHNNMMLFDNSYSIFGGNALDISSFVKNDATYACIQKSNVTKNIFSNRIKKLVLGVNYNSNTLISDFWNSIEHINVDDVSMENAEKIAVDYIKNNKLVEKRMEDYGENLKKEKILDSDYEDVYKSTLTEIFKFVFVVGYYIKYIVDNIDEKNIDNNNDNNNNNNNGANNKDNKYNNEGERASIYQVFTEALHGIGRSNLRSIYIDILSSVAEMSYEIEDKETENKIKNKLKEKKAGNKEIENKDDNKETENKDDIIITERTKFKIKCKMIPVCHLDYVGMLSILPIEESKIIISESK